MSNVKLLLMVLSYKWSYNYFVFINGFAATSLAEKRLLPASRGLVDWLENDGRRLECARSRRFQLKFKVWNRMLTMIEEAPIEKALLLDRYLYRLYSIKQRRRRKSRSHLWKHFRPHVSHCDSLYLRTKENSQAALFWRRFFSDNSSQNF